MPAMILPDHERSVPGIAPKTMFLSVGIRAAVLVTALAAVASLCLGSASPPRGRPTLGFRYFSRL